MALQTVDTTKSENSFLIEFLNRTPDFLNSYLSNTSSLSFVSAGWKGRGSNPVITGWKICLLANYNGNTPNGNLIPQLSDAISNLPSHFDLVNIIISEVDSTIENDQWHNAHYPVHIGFKRYHIPLRSSSSYKLKIRENHTEETDISEYTWEVGNVYEFVNPNDQNCLEFSGTSDEDSRIVMIVDVLRNDITDLSTDGYDLNIVDPITGEIKSCSTIEYSWKTAVNGLIL